MERATFGMSNTRRVLQIIPADGWHSVFWQDEPPYYAVYPLIAWALYDDSDGDVQGLSGLESDTEGLVDFSDDSTNFATYINMAVPDAEWETYFTTQGQKLVEIKAKKEAKAE